MFQDLKKEHTILSDQVKLTTNSFPGFEVLNTLQLLSEPPILILEIFVPSLFLDSIVIGYVAAFCGISGTEYELLKKKYLYESSERKSLYNEVIELKGNIRVFCRCRPLSQTEITNGSTSVVEFDSSQDNELQVVCSDSSKKQFKFDHVFRPEDNQGTLEIMTVSLTAKNLQLLILLLDRSIDRF
jgi:kinesin family protein C2/C3